LRTVAGGDHGAGVFDVGAALQIVDDLVDVRAP
jgi:hypothetical protein